MAAKVFSVICYVIAGFFIYAVALLGFLSLQTVGVAAFFSQ
jgi:hypothetical protein